MRVYPECIPCFMKQVLNVARIAEVPEDVTIEVMRETAKFIFKDLKPGKSPGYNATFIHRLFKEITRIDDPYKTLKDRYNDLAMKLEPFLEKEFMEKAEDRLSAAIKLSAVGNVIDFGIPKAFNVEEEIKNLFSLKFAYFDVAILERFLVPGKQVLYIADNAGEIVFDKFLLKELKSFGLKVTLAVRGAPILNDATVEDAIKTGVADVVDELVTSGGDFIGVDFNFVSDDFKRQWERAFFVISKGQANFETLDSDISKDIFFILKAKCRPVALELRCCLNDAVFLYNKHLFEMKEDEGT